jgi:hypothetical protein
MGLIINLHKLVKAYVGIFLRGGETHMPEEFLN